MALVTEHTPYFSIVTPNYNSGNSLAECIASLKSNTASYEHIIVDDGSSDEAFALAEKRGAEGKGQQLVLKRNPRNVGPGRTRNHALRLVTGRYVVFCDADDHLAPGALDRLQAEIESFRSPDVIVFRYCLHNQKGKVASLALCETPRECQPGEAFADFMHDRIVSAHGAEPSVPSLPVYWNSSIYPSKKMVFIILNFSGEPNEFSIFLIFYITSTSARQAR